MYGQSSGDLQSLGLGFRVQADRCQGVSHGGPV